MVKIWHHEYGVFFLTEHDALSPGHRWTTRAVPVVSRFVLMCYRGYVTAWNPAGTERENWPTKEHVTSGQGSRRVDRRSHNLLLCPPPIGGIKQCSDPSVCMSVRALSSKPCIFKPNSYYGTLTENVILVVEHIRTCPPELAETGGTYGFAAIDATICCLCIAAAAGIAWRYTHLFAQPLMLRLTLDWLVVGSGGIRDSETWLDDWGDQ